MPVVERKTSYRVATAGDVSVAVDVGLGQIGTITLFLEDAELVAGAEAPLPPRVLGAGTALAGRLLTIEVTVTDVSIMTNQMSVVVRLEGGTAPKTITANAEVDEEGDSRDFRVFVLFKNEEGGADADDHAPRSRRVARGRRTARAGAGAGADHGTAVCR